MSSLLGNPQFSFDLLRRTLQFSLGGLRIEILQLDQCGPVSPPLERYGANPNVLPVVVNEHPSMDQGVKNRLPISVRIAGPWTWCQGERETDLSRALRLRYPVVLAVVADDVLVNPFQSARGSPMGVDQFVHGCRLPAVDSEFKGHFIPF